MNIEKMFSDQNGEERLYSVLMNEEEISLFSELQEWLYFQSYDGSYFTGADIEKDARKLRNRARLGDYIYKEGKPLAEEISRGRSIQDAYLSRKLLNDRRGPGCADRIKKGHELAEKAGLIKEVERNAKGEVTSYVPELTSKLRKQKLNKGMNGGILNRGIKKLTRFLK